VNIDCVLLAAGSSHRMGKPKMLYPIGGCTLFEHVLGSHVASSLRCICAVVPGWLSEFRPVIARCSNERVDFLEMPGPAEMSRSLKAGWSHVTGKHSPDAVMISLADKALVGPGLIDSVLGAYEASGCEICVPTFEGRHGHPVVLSAALGEQVMAIEGDCGARDIIESAKDAVYEYMVHSDDILLDIDTVQDLEEIVSRLGHARSTMGR